MNAELLQKEMRIEYPISIAVIDDMEIASFIKGYCLPENMKTCAEKNTFCLNRTKKTYWSVSCPYN